MEEEKKWMFHFYALQWHKWNWRDISSIYKYSPEEKEKIYQALQTPEFFPNETDDARFKIYNTKFIPGKSLIYGYFVHYYNEHVKTIENPNWKDLQSSEWYLFFYFIDDNRVVLQHKKWIGDKPWISEIREKFISYFSWQIALSWLAHPISWVKEELWRERREFIEVFFNKTNRITYLEAEDFDKLNLEALKIEDSEFRFSYFNPIFDEGDTAIKTAEYQIENLKSLKAEAQEGKTLWKIPACRIAAASWNKFKKMKFFKPDQMEEEIYIEKWVSSIEEYVNSETEISDTCVLNIISTILTFVRWKKAQAGWEIYNEAQKTIF
ncbi:MAG: hypothetical protein ACD_71C00057G0003 [uncultured bacterium (gcode 4)]|uniref:Uncharacterized protein n=1 Tax=uncultured bacterium (gcode 4) TaxID=1234023 RepID=K1YP24_9BACT|nr:MAG: hypothetical protein ACD_71C00057G0003 [uncultured bacterium (gcode 4)]